MSVKVANTAANLVGKHVALVEDLAQDLGYYDLKKDFGAVGNGVANDRAVINTALSTIGQAGGGRLWVPAGEYRVGVGQLSLNYKNVKLFAASPEDAHFVFDDEGFNGLVIDTISNVSVSSLLMVDIAVGDQTITVANGSGFTIGKWAYLQDDRLHHSGSFITRISGISGNNITLEEACPIPLKVANSGALLSYVQYPLLTGIEVRNLSFRCVNESTTAQRLTLLFLSRLHRPRIDNCRFNGSVGPLITTRALKGGLIKDSLFDNALTIAGTAVEAQTSTGLSIEGCEANHVQFGYVTSSSPRTRIVNCSANTIISGIDIGRACKLQDGSDFSVIAATTLADSNLTGIRLEYASLCSLIGLTVFSVSAGANGAACIQFNGADVSFCHHNLVTGCNLYGGNSQASGISSDLTDATGDSFHSIIGNIISGCKRDAIYIQGRKNIIKGNQLGSSDPYAILYVPANSGYNIIDGNIFTREGGATPASIHTVDGVGHNIIGGTNITPDSPLGAVIHALDSFVSRESFATNDGKSTQVHTDADTNFKLAYSKTIKGGQFDSNFQGLNFFAVLYCAANANAKRIKIVCGSTEIEIYFGDNGITWHLEINLMYENGAVYYEVALNRGGTTPYFTGATSVDDWTSDQPFQLYIKSDAGVASDLNFIRGHLMFSNVGQRPAL